MIALSRPVSIPRLMRVAWRVKHWLEPLLYRTLVICSEVNTIDGIPPFTMATFDHIARTKSASFLRDSVRNLLVEWIEAEQIQTILTICTGVKNLWISPIGSPTPLLPPVVEGISLRHLYCDFQELCAFFIGLESFTQPFFSNLTHLELFNGLSINGLLDEDHAKWDGLIALVHLTHLAFDTNHILPICPHLLRGCKSLCALIIVHYSATDFPLMQLESVARDPRFVAMSVTSYISDWQRGALGGSDYWARADQFITKRISGEIERSVYCLEEDSDDSDDSDASDEDST
ncbi:hypothetical protein DFH09DRAFT_1288168 [Mycena vulgaris]|nr:hypothetical protein DFH09DRAFT_1288168 [Mycena vulgaris]